MRIRMSSLFLSALLVFSQYVTAQGPFSLTISGPTIVPSGAKVQIEVVITNTSGQLITLEDTNRACDYSVEVQNESGGLAPDTAFKKNAKCSISDTTGIRITGRDMIIPLKPGESYHDKIPVDELNDLTEPGQYTVQVSRQLPNKSAPVTVKSNKITLTVTEGASTR